MKGIDAKEGGQILHILRVRLVERENRRKSFLRLAEDSGRPLVLRYDNYHVWDLDG